MVCDSGEFHWAAQGDRERADANNNTAIIHHPASSDVIKLNYRHPVYVPLAPAPHSPFRGGGGPAEQQVALPRTSHAPLHHQHHCHWETMVGTKRARQPNETWDGFVITRSRGNVCDINSVFNHLLRFTCLCLCLPIRRQKRCKRKGGGGFSRLREDKQVTMCSSKHVKETTRWFINYY